MTAEIVVVEEAEEMLDEGEEEKLVARKGISSQTEARHVKSSTIEASQKQVKLRHVRSNRYK